MSTLLEQARQGKRLDINVIDMHGHLGRYAHAVPDVSPRSIVEIMDRTGISVVICSRMTFASPDTDFGNALVLDAIRAFPGRILGYVGIHPFGKEKVREDVEKWLNEGFTGLKLHNVNGFRYGDESYESAYEIADKRCLPVLFHTGGEEVEFEDICAISARYPNMSILLAHSGCTNEEGYIKMARECANVYLDLTLSVSPRGLVRRLVEAVGAERIVWGSDVYFFSNTQQLGKVVGADISEEDKRKILSINAIGILGRIN